MKYFSLIILTIFLIGCATNNTVKINKYNLKNKKNISTYKIYEKEKKQKEIEEKKLEKDGFCPCSVQMP